MRTATRFTDECIAALRADQHLPFTDATLLVTICATGGGCDELRVWLPNGESATEEISFSKSLELLKALVALEVAREQQQAAIDPEFAAIKRRAAAKLHSGDE